MLGECSNQQQSWIVTDSYDSIAEDNFANRQQVCAPMQVPLMLPICVTCHAYFTKPCAAMPHKLRQYHAWLTEKHMGRQDDSDVCILTEVLQES